MILPPALVFPMVHDTNNETEILGKLQEEIFLGTDKPITYILFHVANFHHFI